MSYTSLLCIQEDLTDLVECGVGQCRTLRKVTMGAGGHQTLTSSILKGMIQNPSLEQVELWGCDFKSRFYGLKTTYEDHVHYTVLCILFMDLSFKDHVLYTVISIEWFVFSKV